jgi:hypothetical protein
MKVSSKMILSKDMASKYINLGNLSLVFLLRELGNKVLYWTCVVIIRKYLNLIDHS